MVGRGIARVVRRLSGERLRRFGIGGGMNQRPDDQPRIEPARARTKADLQQCNDLHFPVCIAHQHVSHCECSNSNSPMR